jgi:hypothetical protein
MYYDAVKKRWVLRGKIYDDEESDKNNNNHPKPTGLFPEQNTSTNNLSNSSISRPEIKSSVPPPKFKTNINNANNSTSTTNSAIAQSQPTSTDEQFMKKVAATTSLSGAPNKITNPFEIKKPNVNNNSNTKHKNLTNRYTSIVDYNQNK